MRKVLTFLFIFCFGLLSAQNYDKRGEINLNHLPILDYHYQDEYTMENVVDVNAWENQLGLNIAFGSTEQLYFRREKPIVDKISSKPIFTAWKGERVNMQLLVWSMDSLEQIRVKPSDLNSSKDQISKDNFKINMVRYIIADYPYASKNVICGDRPYENGFMMPDRFESFERFDLPGKTTRPVWVSLDIPSDVEAGLYTGKIIVQSSKQTKELSFQLKVQNHTLPKPYDWKYRLDLWQNPWVVAWRNNIEPWSQEHKVLLKQHLKNYAEAGGKYITTYAVHSPWSDNSYSIEGSMIEWIKERNGSWNFDYHIFDEYVQLAMECGIDKAITIYTAIPWGNRFRFLDEETGNYVYQSWEPGTNEFTKNWHSFLTSLKKHLEVKGWLDITYIGINENPMDQTLAAIKATKEHSKDWKITYAGNYHEELDTLLDDYSLLYSNEPTVEQLKRRSTRGATSTLYVCCNPPAPNNFLFSPPSEGRWISWYVLARGYDGFLRWAYDAWPEDPNRDGRHGSWAAGDCFLIYPGGNSCIRFEKMREGIVDFEKIKILKDEATRSDNNSEINLLMKKLDIHLTKTLSEKKFDVDVITSYIKDGKELLDSISEKIQ